MDQKTTDALETIKILTDAMDKVNGVYFPQDRKQVKDDFIQRASDKISLKLDEIQ